MSGHAAQSRPAGVPAVGEVLAQKYRVESVVGQGGMGVVLAARHLQLGQVVAIKLLTLPPDEDRRDEAIQRFLNEAQAAARLQSDHVVRIYDVGQLDDGLPFMVMELLNGSDLGSILDERGALPEQEAIDYVLQACMGVAEAHRRGIVHRDLKPSNLFLTRRSDGLPLLKVLDFGISKQLSDPTSGQSLPTFTNTRTLMGSPNYMSPEQVRDARRVDARADVWALGVILQELLTDAPVFHGESFPGVCAAIVADPPMPVRTMRPDVSKPLEAIIERCLEKDPARRFQGVAELVEALAPLGPQLMRSGKQVQPLTYASSPRVSIVTPPDSAAPAPDAATIAMPSDPGTRSSRGEHTLESARLPARQSTQTALGPPDSRVEVVKPSSAPRPTGFTRLLPVAGGALALGALGIWLLARPTAPADPPPDAPASSAPTVASSFTLSIDSEPPGASVMEGSVHLGTTPFALSLNVPEHGSPRVFVIEKDGYQPYVVRQGAARGEVRVMAALTQKQELEAPPAAPAASAMEAVRPPAAPKPPRAAPVKKPAQQPSPPSDIRLER